MPGLEGMKVLELGHMVSAAYATKLMADLGAEVIKVEEPAGDRARQRGPFPGGIVDLEKSGLFLYSGLWTPNPGPLNLVSRLKEFGWQILAGCGLVPSAPCISPIWARR